MEHLIGKLLQDFEQGKMTRRQLIQSLVLTVTAASRASAVPTAAADDSKIVKAIAINHVGYQVADYGRSRDWYGELFGLKVAIESGYPMKRANLIVGESHLAFHTRPSPTTPILDHICFAIDKWDDEQVRGRVEAELKRRGLKPKAETMTDSHGALSTSLLFKDPDGFTIQLNDNRHDR